MVDLINASFFAAATRAHACNAGMIIQSEIEVANTVHHTIQSVHVI